MPTIIVVLAGLTAYFLSSWIPEIQSPLSNMVIKCLVMALTYGAIIYVSKASPDLNSIFTDWKNKFLKHK
jgi:hypothetical protein